MIMIKIMIMILMMIIIIVIKNKTLRLNNLKTRAAMNAKISVFVICVKEIIYLLLYNLHDCTFKGTLMLSLSKMEPKNEVTLLKKSYKIQNGGLAVRIFQKKKKNPTSKRNWGQPFHFIFG